MFDDGAVDVELVGRGRGVAGRRGRRRSGALDERLEDVLDDLGVPGGGGGVVVGGGGAEGGRASLVVW